MELFTIQCTTCRVRLKVKDETIIGKILNCPKCSSMVQVVPPIGWKGAGSQPATEESPGAESIPAAAFVVNASPASPTEADTPSAESPNSAANAAGDDSAVAAGSGDPPDLPRRSPVASSSAAEQTAAAPPEAAMTLHGDEPPTEVAWHEALLARARQDWLMLTGGLTAGVVMGATVWFVVGPTGDPTIDPVSGGNEPTTIARAPDSNSPVAKRSEATGPHSTSNEVPQPEVSDVPVVASDSPAVEPIEPNTSDRQDDPTPIDTSPERPDAETPPPADDSGESVAADTDSPNEPADERAAEPPALSGASQPRDGRATPSIKLDPESSAAEAPDSAPGDPFDLDAAGVTPSPSFADTPNALDEPVEPAAIAEPQPTDGLSEETVEDRMGVMLNEVNFVSVPLGQFIAFVGDVTTLPMVIDDGALAAAGKKRTMPVTVHLSDTTARDALRAALAPLGLTYEIRGKRLFVTVDTRSSLRDE